MFLNARKFSRHLLLLSGASALSVAAFAAPAVAQEGASDETIVVTATRRSTDIQDVPINIAAIGEQQIEQLSVGDMSELAQWVPGLHVVNQGGRSSNPIIVRGLNADPASSNDGANDGGGTVATYLGDIPLFVDLRLNDVERVEVLLGPQGTLYGAGTLGGAIRYIPNAPDFSAFALELRGDAYSYSEGDDLSTDFGATINVPISDTLALRGSVDYLNDTGFIDYDYVVQEIGVSNPDPDFSDPADVAANLAPVQDANTEEVLSGRLALRWAPTAAFDATLSYAFQNAEYGGRTISGRRGLLATGDYVSPLRVREPNQRDNSLIALEAQYDVGWGTLSSATGYSRYEERGQRDQTDLLIGLEYSYELFPSFTAYTQEDAETSILTQELRFVSDFDGPVNFIVGAYYSYNDTDSSSKEFTPFYDNFWSGFDSRPDNLEYYNVFRSELTEMALFGEVSYEVTPRLTVTGGLRYYDYELETEQATDFPLYNTVFDGAGPNDITLDFSPANQADDGMLYKFNASYDWSDDIMTYVTISQGYRIGNSNGLEACEVPPSGSQTVCAGEGEMEYTADQTTNYEIGARTTWLDGALVLNGSIFYIDWTDPQVQSATAVGLAPIIINAAGARSQGFDVSLDWDLTEAFNVRASYAFSEAELTDLAPRLIREIVPPGFQSTLTYIDGEEGDRLPGSPEQQASVLFNYSAPEWFGLEWDFNYGITYTGDVLTRTGGKGDNVTLPDYTLHNASIQADAGAWTITLYARNLLDEFVETNARGGPDYNQFVLDDNGDAHAVRTYYTDVLPPRQIGVRFTHRFGG
ncbi:TonB-dependent receptor [Vitreimonas sp.]|jgi:iron complex outermembrane receptor protein|uniref:TonB-dependent receptor n=1 Tax=Vitreimonas sp. TaxID=3069702 RepID=UPI002ED8D2D2